MHNIDRLFRRTHTTLAEIEKWRSLAVAFVFVSHNVFSLFCSTSPLVVCACFRVCHSLRKKARGAARILVRWHAHTLEWAGTREKQDTSWLCTHKIGNFHKMLGIYEQWNRIIIDGTWFFNWDFALTLFRESFTHHHEWVSRICVIYRRQLETSREIGWARCSQLRKLKMWRRAKQQQHANRTD